MALLCSDMESTVIFTIGVKKFRLHREHVCCQSPVLRAAFNNGMAESQTGIYDLPESTNIQAFTLFLKYIYTQKITSLQLEDRFSIVDGEYRPSDETTELIHLWNLADYFQMPALKELVENTIGLIFAKCATVKPSEWRLIYEETPRDSFLRRFAAWQATTLSKDRLAEILETEAIPPDMMQDIVLIFAEITAVRVRNAQF